MNLSYTCPPNMILAQMVRHVLTINIIIINSSKLIFNIIYGMLKSVNR